MAERIAKDVFEEKVLGSDLPVLVDFYSDSCIACKKLSPALSQAESALSEQVHFYKVNTNFEADLVERYDIMSQPTLVIIKGGEEQDRKVGALKPAELIEWLKAYL